MNLYLFLFLLFLLGLYFPLNHQKSLVYFAHQLDHHLPLLPHTVWFYLSYYLFFPLSLLLIYLTHQRSNVLPALIFSTLVCSLFWWLLPNGVKRPTLSQPRNLSEKLLSFIYQKDGDANGFPSGHISHTLIAGYYLSLAYPYYFVPICYACLAICISTLTTKQHYLFDYLFTVPLTIAIIEITEYFLVI